MTYDVLDCFLPQSCTWLTGRRGTALQIPVEFCTNYSSLRANGDVLGNGWLQYLRRNIFLVHEASVLYHLHLQVLEPKHIHLLCNSHNCSTPPTRNHSINSLVQLRETLPTTVRVHRTDVSEPLPADRQAITKTRITQATVIRVFLFTDKYRRCMQSFQSCKEPSLCRLQLCAFSQQAICVPIRLYMIIYGYFLLEHKAGFVKGIGIILSAILCVVQFR